MIKIGRSVRVSYVAPDDTGVIKRHTVTGEVVYRHPQGRYATIRVPAGYAVTLYPKRRRCSSDDVELLDSKKQK